MRINFDPAMTRWLANRRQFQSDPFVLVDVGALGGIGAQYSAFGEDLRVVAFEPNKEECHRLQQMRDERIKYLPFGLGARNETRRLFVTANPSSSSLFKPNQTFSDRLIIEDITKVVAEDSIELSTLDAVLEEFGDIDFIKLDAEGAELDILKGAGRTLSAGGTLGVYTEVRWHRAMGTPIFSELDLFLREFGYELYDLALGRTSRKALPYPLTWDFRHDSSPEERIFGATVQGQVLGGDALYLRDMVQSPASIPVKILKLACLLEIFEQRDSAAELLLANRQILDEFVSVKDLLDLLTPSIDGVKVSYEQYLQEYFAGKSGFRPGNGESSGGLRSSGGLTTALEALTRLVRRQWK